MKARPLARVRLLTPERRALLERLLLRKAGGALASIPRWDRSRPCRLSPLQERIWFVEQLDRDEPTYNGTWAGRLHGPLDLEALERAFRAVIARHEILRMAVRIIDGTPFQVFLENQLVNIERLDLQVAEAGQDAAIARAVRAFARRAFDLERDLLVRAALLRLDPGDHVLVLVTHHLVCDGWSAGVMLRELSTLYARDVEGARATLPSLPLQFADVAAWQRERQASAPDTDLAYWVARLRGAPARLALPTDRPRPARISHRGSVRTAEIAAPLAARLRERSRTEAKSLFTLCVAAFATLLHRYSGQDDVVLGTAFLNRDRPELESVVGPFLDTVALRIDLSGEPAFRELLARVRAGLAEADAHRSVSFEQVVEVLAPERRLDQAPVFQVMVGQLVPEMLMPSLRLPGVTVQPVEIDRGTAKYDLTLLLVEGEASLRCEIEYSTDLFDATTIDRMLTHYQTLLAAAAQDPATPIGRLPLLTPAERQHLLVDWNDTARPYPRDASIPELFDLRRRAAPDAVAVECEERRLTYRELGQRAARLAALLRREGVGPEVVVGVGLERSPDLIVALLGILQAGAAYLPLDPGDPPERLALLAHGAGAPLILTRPALLPRFRLCPARSICLGDLEPVDSEPSASPVPMSIGGDALAYVMYTSGSTGRPRGVEVPHRAVVRLLHGVDYVPLGPAERILQLGAIGFDASTFEIWGALLHGGCCVLYPESIPTPEQLGEVVVRHRITTLFLSTALFNLVVDECPSALATVRQVLTGGEAVSVPHIIRALAAWPDAVLIHCYGPTEATTFTTCHRVPRSLTAEARTVPIGRPIANTRVYVLDRHGAPVPIGVPGELYVGGDGLARGYRNEPELTRTRFVADPVEPGGRLYRTGDLGRYGPDGVIEFVGRLDDQVKLRGFRIEPAEIEANLAGHPGVGRAVVVLREDEPGERCLVAYVVPRGEHAPTADELRVHLLASLPEHMIPSAFVPLGELPLGVTGKVDRARLPRPEPIAEAPRAEALPRGPMEELVAGIWADLLRQPSVDRDADFFALGGHSLLAIRVLARLRQAIGIEVPVRLLFEAPTVAEFAGRLRALRAAAGEPPAPVRPVPRTGPLPLSLFQERVWRHAQQGGYCRTRQFRVTGPFDSQAFEWAVTEVVRRHEILRTTYEVVNGEPRQRIQPAWPVPVPVVDLREEPDPAAAAERLAAEENGRGVDLARGPVLRVRVLRLGEAEHRLLLTQHHISYDGDGMVALHRELAAFYDAAGRREPSRLPDLPLQYADYAVWQRIHLDPSGSAYRRQLDYWMTRLAAPRPRRLVLPFERRASATGDLAETEQAQPIPDGLAHRLEELARREGATPFMVFTAAALTWLFRQTRRTDLVVGTYLAARHQPELEPLMGLFINLVPLRLRLDAAGTFSDLVRQVRSATLDAYANQELPFDVLADALRARGRQPPEIEMIVLYTRSRRDHSLALPGLDVAPLPLRAARMPWGLTVVWEEGCALRATFDSRRYEPAGVRRMLADLLAVLDRAMADPGCPIASLAPEATAPQRVR